MRKSFILDYNAFMCFSFYLISTNLLRKFTNIIIYRVKKFELFMIYNWTGVLLHIHTMQIITSKKDNLF